MFQSWRLKIREAEAAYRGGQLDEAGAMLRQGGLTRFLPGRKLSAKVARGMVQRAQSAAALGNTSAGWRDLQAAKELGDESDTNAEVCRVLTDRAIAEAERYLVADEPRMALAVLDRLQKRCGETAAQRVLRHVAQRLDQANLALRRGRFSEAETCLVAAASLRNDVEVFSQRVRQCRLKAAENSRLTDHLHTALANEKWHDALTAAEALLDLAPEHEVAKRARRRAWAAVGLTSGEVGPAASVNRRPARNRGDSGHDQELKPNAGRRSTNHGLSSAKVDTVTERTPGGRFLLWVDAVGGYLICLGDEIVLGPPCADGQIDVPIMADISRRHAVIRRDGEGYLIHPVREVKLDGRRLDGPTTLVDGNVIELGERVSIRFRRPHALSSTARLEFVSRHKTQPSVDAVLLVAESCVLGPAWHSHVVCRDWERDVVLFRQGDQLYCRASEPLTIDGEPAEVPAKVEVGAQVESESFSFRLEAV